MAAATVECYSGHTYAQEPRFVTWEAERCAVVAIERRWRTPAGPAFRVETEPGEVFDLLYEEAAGRWCIRPYMEPRGGHSPSSTEL